MVNQTCSFSQSESGKYFEWIIITIKRTRIHYLFSLTSPSWHQIIVAYTVCAAKHVTISIKKSGSNSKTIGFVFCCKIDHIWSFLKWFKQWRLHACKIPMTTEAANLKLRWVWSNRDFKIQRRGRQRERQKKTIGLISKTTTSHVHHTFLYISFPFLHDLRRENA